MICSDKSGSKTRASRMACLRINNALRWRGAAQTMKTKESEKAGEREKSNKKEGQARQESRQSMGGKGREG